MLVSERDGDIPGGNADGLGMYLADTRFLSTYELRLNGVRPLLLSASVDEGYVATIQMVNPALGRGDGVIPRQTISIRRTRFVFQGLHERIGIQNCLPRPVALELSLEFDADFKDIFDVRQVATLDFLGRRRPVRASADGMVFGYDGLDGVTRSTAVSLLPSPTWRRGRVATYQLQLDAHETRTLVVDVIPGLTERAASEEMHFDRALELLSQSYNSWSRDSVEVTTDNEVLNRVLHRSLHDLRTLVTSYDTGLYPVAGIPWFAVPFGRDGLVVGCQTLMLNPDIARGVLRYLAANQGRRVDRRREEEPGKIMHEIRFGELANLKQIPHTPYYGSIDATPLFLVLLVELMRWQWDLELFRELEPAVGRALEWLDRCADLDGDGLIEYHGHSRRGIRNQSWKDSHDSVSHPDGSSAPTPIAPIEVQGYAIHAWEGLAAIYSAVGEVAIAKDLSGRAAGMRTRLQQAFWMPEARFYAQALDRDKRQVANVTSNPGHGLWSGAFPGRSARQVGRRLVEPDMFSGWGVRTLSSGAATYNPMSYHNGSVWPHDNSIVADGMRRQGMDEEALLIVEGCLGAAMRLPGYHLPELFCGFERDIRFDSLPAEYVVSGRPQAWGAAAVFHLMQTALGLRADAQHGGVTVSPLRTTLYNHVRVERLPVAGRRVSFELSWNGSAEPRLKLLGRTPGLVLSLR